MPKITLRKLPFLAVFGLSAAVISSATTGPISRADIQAATATETTPLPSVPMYLPTANAEGVISLVGADGIPRATTIMPALQAQLDAYIAEARTPVAGIVVADARTGSVLAMAQGRDPAVWGGKTHTALHSGFPAASLFKTVVTAAAFEVADFQQSAPMGLFGGCSHVRETGEWLNQDPPTERNRMSLRKAYGSSCNAAWIMLAVANKGVAMPLRLFRDTPLPQPDETKDRVFSAQTAAHMAEIMNASVQGGTASFAFRRGKYRKLREIAGGKTGTLTGTSPRGLTTWFAGMAPTNAPEVVVASVVMLEDRWHIKGPTLAAEGLWAYFNLKLNEKAMSTASFLPVAASDKGPEIK